MAVINVIRAGLQPRHVLQEVGHHVHRLAIPLQHVLQVVLHPQRDLRAVHQPLHVNQGGVQLHPGI